MASDDVSDDEVVMEMDVYLTQELANQLHVFQYPLRPQWKPIDASALKAVRHRKGQKTVQLEVELNTAAPSYNLSSRYPLKTSMLASTLVPAQTNQCIGVVADGKLHLTPIHAVIQMRPTLQHLDEEDAAIRAERDKEAKAEKRGVRQDSAVSADEDAPDEKGEDEDNPQMLQVQFRRAESEKVLERKRTSYASLHDAREREPWVTLAYCGVESDESEALRAQLLCASKAQIALSCAADEYLSRLSCGKAHRDPHGGLPMELEQECLQPGGVDAGSLSKEAIRQMRPAERCASILRHTHAMAFPRLCELCALPSPKLVLDEALEVAVLVQGCWVLRSALACANERDARCRDLLLLHFTRERMVTTKHFAERALLSMQAARELLAQVATPRPGSGWEFKVPTDRAFEAEYPQIAQAQRAEWLRFEAELSRGALGAPAAGAVVSGAGRADAVKRGKSAAAAGKMAAGPKASGQGGKA